MAASRYTSRQTSVVFEDATGTPLTVTIGPGAGDLSIGEYNAENAEHITKLNRGVFDGFVLGDDLTQDCSLTIELINQSITDASNDRVWDVINKTGSFAAGVTVDPSGAIWAWKCTVTMTDSTTTSTVVLPVCEGGVSVSEGKEGNSLSISFRNHGAITVT